MIRSIIERFPARIVPVCLVLTACPRDTQRAIASASLLTAGQAATLTATLIPDVTGCTVTVCLGAASSACGTAVFSEENVPFAVDVVSVCGIEAASLPGTGNGELAVDVVSQLVPVVLGLAGGGEQCPAGWADWTAKLSGSLVYRREYGLDGQLIGLTFSGTAPPMPRCGP
jgi:hypothetical protein